MDLKIEKMTLDTLNSIQNILFTEFDNFWTYSAFTNFHLQFIEALDSYN